jgi:hypothetical protein
VANSLIAITDGKKYQAWLFWQFAAPLLSGHSNISAVEFEAGDVSSFDDVVITYSLPVSASFTDKVHRRHYQAKYHVSAAALITLDSLTDPEFIGATKSSLVSNLAAGYRTLGRDEFSKREYWLITPWAIDPSDPLAELWQDSTCAIRHNVFAQGTTKGSRWYQLRQHWRKETSANDDNELWTIVSRLRLQPAANALNSAFATNVSAILSSHGLKEIDPGAASEPYSQIPWQLHAQGITRYTPELLAEVVERAKLRVRPTPVSYISRAIAIRTRADWAAEADARSDHMLVLDEFFDGRHLRSDASWAVLYAKIQTFLRENIDRIGRTSVEVAGVTSAAFAAGYAVPTKDGSAIFPLQPRRGGADLWDCARPGEGSFEILRNEPRSHHKLTAGVALGVSVSRHVFNDMAVYVDRQGLPISQLVELSPDSGVGPDGIRDPAHAVALVNSLTEHISRIRENPSDYIHLFVSAPNAFVFMLGQEGERLGRCQIYDFDFSDAKKGDYTPTIRIPDDTDSKLTTTGT